MNFMEKSKSIKVLMILAAVMLVLGIVQTSQAALSAVATQTNPANGFPVWYQDANGVQLQQCNFMTVPPGLNQNNDPNCILGAEDEAFWWSADSSILVGGVDALLVQAMEAAFFNGPNIAGDQISFGRIRIRADVPTAGVWTVTHPFGTRTFNVPAVLPGAPEINFTQDIGGGRLNFTAALGSNIGPFLRCVTPAPPAGYLGNANIPCTVTGSPTGNNLFRIQGPGGVDLSETQFFVSGKLFTPFAIRGFVRNPDGSRAAGVTVTLGGDATATATTNVNGAFVFRNLANGNYTVTPSMTGFAFVPVRRAVTISGADVTGVIFTRNAVGTLSISGVVRNAAGVGLGGVTMRLTGPAAAVTTTAANGVYTFRNLANGTYTVTPSQTSGTVTLTTPLSGAQEVPPVTTTGSGTGTMTVNLTTGAISGTVTFTGLTSNASAAHIHQGAAGVNGPIIVPLAGGAGATAGTWTIPAGSVLTAAQLTALRANGLYFNVHSVTNPGGEIRGQINFNITFSPVRRTVIVNGANVGFQNFRRN